MPSRGRTIWSSTRERHRDYDIPGNRLLVGAFIAQCRKEFTATPERVSIYIFGSLRFQYALIRKPTYALATPRPGEPVISEEILADE
eukprot:9788594-Lingulodinium_polyedra.AAC.1